MVDSPLPASELRNLDVKAKHNPNGFFEEHEFVNAKGLKIHAYSAQPTDVEKRGVVVMSHGITAHALFQWLVNKETGLPRTEVEGSMLGYLLEAGYAVYLQDLQAHGLSEHSRQRAWFDSMDDLIDDFLLFTSLVRARETGKCFAMGISISGGIIAGCEARKPGFVDGMVLLAPMLSLEKVKQKPLNKVLLPFVTCLSSSCPEMRVAQMEKNVMFPLIKKEKDDDPLCDHGEKQFTRVAAAVLAFCSYMVESGIKKIKTPFITFHSDADNLVDPAASEMLLSDSQTIDKQYVKAEGMWHNLTQEPGREKIFEQSVAWLVERS